VSDQVIQHAGRGHSELGPSSSERWLKCTPSAVLSAQFQDKPSVYAEEGTFLHELCELKLHRYLGDMTKDVIERQYTEHKDNDFYSDEAEEVTDVYVNHCIEVIEAIRLSCADPYIAVEHRLDFSEYVPGGFGTGDFLAIGDGVIEVIDFKGGRGVRVNADHNSQLMLYGLGALLEFDPLYDIKTVRMTIVQPRLQKYFILRDGCRRADQVGGRVPPAPGPAGSEGRGRFLCRGALPLVQSPLHLPGTKRILYGAGAARLQAA